MSYRVGVWSPRFLGGFEPSYQDFETEGAALAFAKGAIRKNHSAHATVEHGGHLMASVAYVPAKTIDWRGVVGRVVVKRSKGR